MTLCSYVLITLGGSKPQVRHGTTYVVISLLASTLFVTAVGLVYAATGTVNMADLRRQAPGHRPALREALSVLFLVVFGIRRHLPAVLLAAGSRIRRLPPSSPPYSPAC